MNPARKRSTLIVSTALLGALLTPVPAAGAAIKPHQHFVGRVNGEPSIATVKTVCAGPGSPDGLGSIAGGQTVSVRHKATGKGDTGLFSTVYAWFVQNASQNGHKAVQMTAYRTRVALPTSIRVPCDGTGRVEFSSCPYLAPCAAGWTPTYVKVRYVNIAA